MNVPTAAPGTYRLFVAIEIPEAVQSEVGRRIELLRESLSAGGKTRWVDPRGLHLTLLFLGDIAADLVPWLGQELARACAPSPTFTLALSGAGTFPPTRPARVAWVGVSSPPELIALRSALNAMAEETIGHPSEEGPFVPHLTIARCRDPWQRPAIATFSAAFSGAIGEPFPVVEAVLVRSHLGEIVSRGDGTEGRGSRHEVLLRMPLGIASATELAEEAEATEEESHDVPSDPRPEEGAV